MFPAFFITTFKTIIPIGGEDDGTAVGVNVGVIDRATKGVKEKLNAYSKQL